MTPDVASVRQNLVPLVDGGQVNPTCQSGGTAQWGSTIGQVAFIHRSGFGVTATGGEVYVGGPALSVCNLDLILQASGVIRGMELDINPSWVSGAYFQSTQQGPPQGFRLFPGGQVSPGHYLSPVQPRLVGLLHAHLSPARLIRSGSSTGHTGQKLPTRGVIGCPV